MMDFAHWLPIIWAVILIAAISIYVVLDGFDLGIGMLFMLERDETRRNVMISTIAPVRDGNETWMVLGITVWPWAVPPALTLWDVSPPPSSQLFQLVGTVILLPIILTYTIYSYRVFRGKVSEADGCH
ncbi:hypothetical protein GOB93_17040 [Acetobacter musti]|uniref:Uncharacterized protein n=1 Tax=Acetobacter musti TaxID=864732 RepID=A0ABX0JU22_9PROT|nr:cytochrome d ubiquinol oxidase subunit II [Acetobacter musti]NHN86329.1 hypothetical protein [Acetobacter musti]